MLQYIAEDREKLYVVILGVMHSLSDPNYHKASIVTL